MLIEWTLKVSGLFLADSLFLIKDNVCVEVEDSAFHSEREFGHAPKSIATAFVDMWKQSLVVREVPCFKLAVTPYFVFAKLVSETVCLRSDSCWLEIFY